jgi:hypothetical protein
MRLKEIKVKWVRVTWVCFGIENLFNEEAIAQTEKKWLGRAEEKFIKIKFIELLKYDHVGVNFRSWDC